MSRNKYPEETVRKILEVAGRLFREKGYEHTTIQDIVDALGMSKGAVYHHFKSKEDIFDRLTDEYYNEVNWFRDIRLDPSLNGLQKLQEMLRMQFTDSRKLEIDGLVSFSMLRKNPRLVSLALFSSIRDAAPFMRQLIEEGVRDGSIKAKQPKELSEALAILMNMWVGMFSDSREDFMGKLAFIRDFTDRLGFPLLDQSLVEACVNYYDCAMTLKDR